MRTGQLLTFILLLISINLFANKHVVAGSSLNVRAWSATNAPIVETTQESEEKKISFDISQFKIIQSCERGIDKVVDNISSFLIQKLRYSQDIIFFLMIGLNLFLVVAAWVPKQKFFNRESVSIAVIFLLSILEIIYFNLFGHFGWFFTTHIVGWLWGIIGFIITSAFIANQIYCFTYLLNYLKEGYRVKYFSYSFAIKGTILLVIIELIATIFLDDYDVNSFISPLYILVYIIQIGIIFIASRHNIKLFFIQTIFFFVVIFAITIVVQLVIWTILLIAFLFLGKSRIGSLSSGGSSDRGGSGGSSYDNSQPEEVLTTRDENGYERTLEDVGWGSYKDDKGDEWESGTFGGIKRKEK